MSKNVSWAVQLKTSAGEHYHYLKLQAENIQLTGQNMLIRVKIKCGISNLSFPRCTWHVSNTVTATL